MRHLARTAALALSLSAIAPAVLVGCATPDRAEAIGDHTEAAGRFELFEGVDGQFYFHLLAGNGEMVLNSEGYTTKAAAKNGIQSVVENGQDLDRYQILEAKNGEFYFNLRAGNHQIIGTSETYASEAGAKKGAESVADLLETTNVAELLSGAPKFETFEGQDGDHYFRLRAKNGQIILQSEGYASSSGAATAVETVKALGGHVESYEIVEAQNGQHFFRVVAGNGETVGHGEMYASAYNAKRGAETVREIIRAMTEVAMTDADLKAAIELAAEGSNYTSESDYPFTYVYGELSDPNAPITEALVRELMAPYVDGDPDADKPLADLFADTGDFEGFFPAADDCEVEAGYDWAYDMCRANAALGEVLASNLTDIQVFYFGVYGSPGYVEGVGVSVIIVGRTPEGNLAGVRTIAIWT